MGPLLVEAAGLMWGHVAVAGPGSGGGLGASRLPPAGTLGSCGSGGALRLLPKVTLGLGRIEVKYFSREVNDLI